MAWRLCFLLSLAVSQSLFDRISLEQLEKEAENPDFFTLVYLYDMMSTRSHQLFPVFQKVSEHYQGAIKSLAVNCGSDPEKCPPLLRDSLPSVFAYIPEGFDESQNHPSILEREFAGVMDEVHMRDFVERNLVFLGEIIETTDDPLIANETNKLNRAIFFTDKPLVPLLLYSFAGKYKGRIDFGLVFSNSTEVFSKFGVEETPALLAITKKGAVERYEGAMIAADVGEFLRKYSEPLKDKKRPLKRTEKAEKLKSFREYDIRGVNSTDFNDTLHSTSSVVIALFAKSNATSIWTPLVQKYTSMVSFLEMNCSLQSEADFAVKMGVKRFPSMRVFPANRTKKSIELSFDEDADIDEQILSYLSYKVEVLKSDRALQRFFDSVKNDTVDGVLLITNKSEHFPIKIAASVPTLREKFRFAQYNKKSKELQQLLKASKFPTIVVVRVDEKKEFRFVEFTGNIDDFSLLKVFLMNLVETKEEEAPQPKLSIDRERVEEIYGKTYNSLCGKKGGICAIAIFNGTADEPANENSYGTLKALQKEFKKDEDYHFSWFNGICESELRDRFSVGESDLPAFVLYVPNRGKSAKFTGKFDLESLKSFLSDSSQGKIKTSSLKDIAFSSDSCAASHIRHTEL